MRLEGGLVPDQFGIAFDGGKNGVGKYSDLAGEAQRHLRVGLNIRYCPGLFDVQ